MSGSTAILVQGQTAFNQQVAKQHFETTSTKFEQVVQEDLTARGLANLLFLAKRGALPASKIAPLETKLLDKLLNSNAIDSAADYFFAQLYVTSLNSHPVTTKRELGNVLDRIDEYVFKGSLKKNDPWDLQKQMTDLRERARTSQSTSF